MQLVNDVVSDSIKYKGVTYRPFKPKNFSAFNFFVIKRKYLDSYFVKLWCQNPLLLQNFAEGRFFYLAILTKHLKHRFLNVGLFV